MRHIGNQNLSLSLSLFLSLSLSLSLSLPLPLSLSFSLLNFPVYLSAHLTQIHVCIPKSIKKLINRYLSLSKRGWPLPLPPATRACPAWRRPCIRKHPPYCTHKPLHISSPRASGRCEPRAFGRHFLGADLFSCILCFSWHLSLPLPLPPSPSTSPSLFLSLSPSLSPHTHTQRDRPLFTSFSLIHPNLSFLVKTTLHS